MCAYVLKYIFLVIVKNLLEARSIVLRLQCNRNISTCLILHFLVFLFFAFLLLLPDPDRDEGPVQEGDAGRVVQDGDEVVIRSADVSFFLQQIIEICNNHCRVSAVCTLHNLAIYLEMQVEPIVCVVILALPNSDPALVLLHFNWQLSPQFGFQLIQVFGGRLERWLDRSGYLRTMVNYEEMI